MTTIIGIITSLLLFSIIVIIHELGHFSTARFFKVKVEEFGLGIPPRVKTVFTDTKGTQYTINALPLGGFVRLKGESPIQFFVYNHKNILLSNEEIVQYIKSGKELYTKNGAILGKDEQSELKERLSGEKDTDNFSSVSYWKQAIIILAGVIMNFLLAWVIFSYYFFVGVQPIGINTVLPTTTTTKLIPTFEKAKEYGIIIQNPGVIVQPITGSIAEKNGLKTGDIIQSINGTSVNTGEELIKLLSENKGKPLLVGIQREKSIYTLKITPSEDGKIGAYVGDNLSLNKDFRYSYPLGTALLEGGRETIQQSKLTFEGLLFLVKNIFRPEKPEDRKEAINNMSGPIGIVGVITSSLAGGISYILLLGAIISINLAVFNLLPIPALDGGRFVFIMIHSISSFIGGKKTISSHIEGYIHVFFFLCLIALSLIIGYNDIAKLLQ